MDKQCKKCGEEKSVDLFPHNKALEDGYDRMCKSCWSTYAKEKRTKGWTGKKSVTETALEVPSDIEVVELAAVRDLPRGGKFMWEWTGDLNIGLSLIAFRKGKRPAKVFHFVDSFKHNRYWAEQILEVVA